MAYNSRDARWNPLRSARTSDSMKSTGQVPEAGDNRQHDPREIPMKSTEAPQPQQNTELSVPVQSYIRKTAIKLGSRVELPTRADMPKFKGADPL